MAYINTIKSANHGIYKYHKISKSWTNKQTHKKRGHTPDLSPEKRAIWRGLRYSRH